MLDIEDPAALRDYLRRTGRIGPATEVSARVLPGGVSCKTVLVRLPDGTTWVLKQALAKLRVRTDWQSDPARIHREAAALRWLATLAPAGATAGFIFEDMAEHVLAMTAIPEPHDNWKTKLLARGPEHDHAHQFGRLLGTIHRRAVENAKVLQAEFGDATFFDQLRLDAYYRHVAASVPETTTFYASLIDETFRHRATLVHGDFSPKNMLVAGGRLVLLDHEVVHWGDPAFDLGFALTHLLAKARHLPVHRATLARAAQQFWTAYQGEVGDRFAGLAPRAVRHTLGCLLARVEGRSPLEYLTPAGRAALRTEVLALLPAPPISLDDLIQAISRPSP